MSQEVIVAVEAALQAGKILRERVDDIGKVSFKEFHDPVTEVDHLAEKAIITRIKKTFPDHDILAEESGNAEGSDSTSKWIIDPLDGTLNYSHGYPCYCVSIALEQEGEVKVGVIYNPFSDEIFYAQKNKGAFLNGNQIKISNTENIQNASIIVSRSEYSKNLWNNYKNNFSSIKSVGSIAYKLGLSASGMYDICATVAPKNEWDICAGDCIVREAGGTMKTINGKNINYNQKKTLVTDPIIATNSKLFDMVSDLLY